MAAMVWIPLGKLASSNQSSRTGLREKHRQVNSGQMKSMLKRTYAHEVGRCKHMPCQVDGRW